MLGISERTGAATSVDVAAWSSALGKHHGIELTDAELIDEVRALEELKSAAAAAQARLTSRFHSSQVNAAPELKSRDEVSRSINAQVALARKESPSRGSQLVGLALALSREMPFTLEALAKGELSEHRAGLIVRETACLSAEDRAQVDLELRGRFEGAGNRKIAGMAREIAYRLDPGAAIHRNRKAHSGRRVSVRPAPDGMCFTTALLSVAQGVAVYAALRRRAEAARAAGDSRTVAQIMADLLVADVTGEGAAPSRVEIQLVMNERTLFRGSHEPAIVPGFGHIPADLARQIVLEADKTWIRRLFTSPETGELVAMDSKRREFRGKLREFLVLRDQTCATPWCDAPIRHADHVRSFIRNGKTSAVNGQGLCEACNYAKEGPGWRADVIMLAPRVIEYVTPTGHVYRSQSPPQPGAGPPRSTIQGIDRLLDDDAG